MQRTCHLQHHGLHPVLFHALSSPAATRCAQQADWRAPEGQLPPVGQAPEHPRTWLVFSDQHVYIDKVLDEVRLRAW